jgi:hypothetical protein
MQPENLKGSMSNSLPGPEFKTLIHPHTGRVNGIRPTSRGNMSDLTALVAGEKGRFFVKAIRNRPGGRRDSFIREGLINPFVQPISPAVLWQAEDEEWIALGFEVVEGRSSNLGPDSPDLPAVIDILNRIGDLALPEVARDWPETRWDRFAADRAEAAMFQGWTLLYTDINADNLIIGNRDIWAVDWAWPTRGAAFIDPALLVVQLIADGHSAESAESWAAGCTAWAAADPAAIDVFAAANMRMHRWRVDRSPEVSWLQEMTKAARQWADHRGVSA